MKMKTEAAARKVAIKRKAEAKLAKKMQMKREAAAKALALKMKMEAKA